MKVTRGRCRGLIAPLIAALRASNAEGGDDRGFALPGGPVRGIAVGRGPVPGQRIPGDGAGSVTSSCVRSQTGVPVGRLGPFWLRPRAMSSCQLIRGALYGISPFDPISAGVTVALLAAVSLLAGSLPARRAAPIDPMEALCYE